ncbi:MAG: hypothetical protein R2932_20680 [Caldilineaceae bacterium]
MTRTHAGAVLSKVALATLPASAVGKCGVSFAAVSIRPPFATTLAGINIPIRIGEVTILPGDVVFGHTGTGA